MSVGIDIDELRTEIRTKYSEVVDTPDAEFHFHTGRFLAKHLGLKIEGVPRKEGKVDESFVTIETYEQLLVFDTKNPRPVNAVKPNAPLP